MDKTKELGKNTLILLLGKFCTQFMSFLLLPIYTYFLSTSEYGYLDLILTYIGLLVPLFTLQLESAAFRFLLEARNNKEEKINVLTNIFVVVSFILILLTIIFIIFGVLLKINNLIYIYLCIIATILSNLLLQIARGNGDNKGFTIGSIVTALITLSLNCIMLIVFDLGLKGVLIATFFANISCFIYLFFRERVYLYLKFSEINRFLIIRYIKYSAPLVPNGIIWWIINASDRSIITMFLGANANGIFAVSHKFSTMFINLYNVFNLSWTESASLHINEKDKDYFFTEVFNNILKLFTYICCLILLFLPLFYDIVIGQNYEEAYIYIPLLLIGSIFNIIVSFLGSIYIANKDTVTVAKTSLYSGLLNIIINFILIKKIGLYASVISTISAFAIMAIYRYYDVKKYVRVVLKKPQVFKMIILLNLSLFAYYYNEIYLSIVLICIFAIFMYTEYRKIINLFIEEVKNKVTAK